MKQGTLPYEENRSNKCPKSALGFYDFLKPFIQEQKKCISIEQRKGLLVQLSLWQYRKQRLFLLKKILLLISHDFPHWSILFVLSRSAAKKKQRSSDRLTAIGKGGISIKSLWSDGMFFMLRPGSLSLSLLSLSPFSHVSRFLCQRQREEKKRRNPASRCDCTNALFPLTGVHIVVLRTHHKSSHVTCLG